MMSSARNTLVVALLCVLGGSSSAFQVPVHGRVSNVIATPSPVPTVVKSSNSEYPDYDDYIRDSSYMEEAAEIDDYYYLSEHEEDRGKIQLINTILQILHNSFKNVEVSANSLLEDEPAVALSIFVGAGLIAAYMLGLVILDGCMESWNPVQNGMVPYWDEEILVMVKRVH